MIILMLSLIMNCLFFLSGSWLDEMEWCLFDYQWWWLWWWSCWCWCWCWCRWSIYLYWLFFFSFSSSSSFSIVNKFVVIIIYLTRISTKQSLHLIWYFFTIFNSIVQISSFFCSYQEYIQYAYLFSSQTKSYNASGVQICQLSI